MLIASAGFLIVDGPGSPGNVVVVIDEGDRRFDYVADRYWNDTDVVLLYRRRATRLERLGITPMTDETARRELLQRGFSDDRLQSLPESPVGKSKLVTALSLWLAEHPDRSVHLLCDRFNSRTWDLLVRRAEKSRLKERIAIVPLANRHFDETNWWRSKRGTRAFLNAYLTLGFHFFRRGTEPEWEERDSVDLRRAALGCSADETLGNRRIPNVKLDAGARTIPSVELARE